MFGTWNHSENFLFVIKTQRKIIFKKVLIMTFGSKIVNDMTAINVLKAKYTFQSKFFTLHCKLLWSSLVGNLIDSKKL